MTDRPRALAVLIAVFLLGGIIGSGGTYWWTKKYQAAGTVQNRRPGPRPERPRWREVLQLTPEQAEQFEKIMAESRKQMQSVRAEQEPKIQRLFSEQGPRLDAIIAETNKKLMAMLDKDQQKKFESLLKEMNSRRGRLPRGGRGMGPLPR